MDGCVYKTANGKCEKLSDAFCTQYCVEGPCDYMIPSNGDKLRAMTDEELGRFLGKYGTCPPNRDDVECRLLGCGHCWERWLKEGAKNDG